MTLVLAPGQAVIANGNSGTIGAIFESSRYPGRRFFSSAWHVIVNTRTSNTIPIKNDNDTRVGTYKKKQFRSVQGLDIAFAEVQPGVESINVVAGTDIRLLGIGSPSIEQELHLMRANGVHCIGTVKDMLPRYARQRFAIRIKIRANQPSPPTFGDSGGTWVDPSTNKIIAYHVRQDPQDPNVIVAGQFKLSLDFLRADMRCV